MTRAYRFASFELSPKRRALTRDGRDVPLIPRYFDLLVLLVERRQEAVHRRDIHRLVWSDVVVTDGALSQGVRILRRVLGDISKEPTFIRTVSRHGYQFVYPEVHEVDDVESGRGVVPSPTTAVSRELVLGQDQGAAIEGALSRLLSDGDAAMGDAAHETDDRREAAETLHALGTDEALLRLGTRPGHERARALLRDSRWDVVGAGGVPIWGVPGFAKTIGILVAMRLRRAARAAASRWVSAALGGALAGMVAGAAGGVILEWGPGGTAGPGVPFVLACLGVVIGGLGAAGVGAGLEAAEVAVRSSRRTALLVLGSLGGGVVGATAHLFARLVLEGLFGRDLSPVAGGFEGLGIGLGAAAGYAASTPRPLGGMAAPRGRARLVAIAATGAGCALAALLLASRGRYLGAMSLDLLAHSFPGSQVGLGPLARLLGETEPGILTRLVVSAGEGLMFGSGLAWGLTRRP